MKKLKIHSLDLTKYPKGKFQRAIRWYANDKKVISMDIRYDDEKKPIFVDIAYIEI